MQFARARAREDIRYLDVMNIPGWVLLLPALPPASPLLGWLEPVGVLLAFPPDPDVPKLAFGRRLPVPSVPLGSALCHDRQGFVPQLGAPTVAALGGPLCWSHPQSAANLLHASLSRGLANDPVNSGIPAFDRSKRVPTEVYDVFGCNTALPSKPCSLFSLARQSTVGIRQTMPGLLDGPEGRFRVIESHARDASPARTFHPSLDGSTAVAGQLRGLIWLDAREKRDCDGLACRSHKVSSLLPK
ncbi:hypothetical protein ACIQOW_05310 [Kitasatospora sp. NPDC091335]|uniref:hypothetical protein n=1 Tax=Kitasatospora sp. NPDC091335 TaxID=3364085 RepID=UPI00380E361C